MKTLLTTAALVAALAMPAFAQEAGTTNRGDPQGTTRASDKEKGPTGGAAMNQPMKSGTTGAGQKSADDKLAPATNEKAGETGAGEAGTKK